MRRLSSLALVLFALAAPAPATAPATATAPEAAGQAAGQSAAPRVHAVLFYSPGCPHCHDVMRDHLPPLLERYGEALRIVAVNVDPPQGQAVYQAVARHFQLPRERMGVPALVIGDQILVGAWEIPSRLPRLVETGLAGEGVDWPPIPELRSFLSLQGVADGPTIEIEAWMLVGGAAAGGDPVVRILRSGSETRASSVAARFMGDLVGNSIAVVVLLGMVLVLAASIRLVFRPGRPLADWPAWVIPVLAVVGTGIALYMAFVEVTGTEAICGPVGDCNRVQLSPYAAIAGVPVGVLGVVGYVVLGGLSIAARIWSERGVVSLLVWGMAAAGVAFSIYLTFLEPFVIGATCMWCINSALVMTLILVAATPAAARFRQAPHAAPSPRAGRSRQKVTVA
jgi:uncharacterized membrane protein